MFHYFPELKIFYLTLKINDPSTNIKSTFLFNILNMFVIQCILNKIMLDISWENFNNFEIIKSLSYKQSD